MSISESIFWGVIQGVTEFIPVSSSGHLVIIPCLFGINAPDLISNIALHLGTLIAVIIFFRNEVKSLFTSQKRLGILVAFATLPILIIGLLFANKIKIFFEDPNRVGWFLVINGIIILSCHFKLYINKNLNGRKTNKLHNILNALVVGIAQSFAILPGISRSGITITAGIYAGMKREEAFRFSFLLFIPATLLAFLYSLIETLMYGGAKESFWNVNIIISIIISAVFGLLALKVLFRLIKVAKLHYLSAYCIIIGILTIIRF